MKKFVILIFFLLNAIIFAGCSTEKNTPEESEPQTENAVDPGTYVTLYTDLDFSTVSPYKYAMDNGDVTAEIVSDMLDTDSPQLTVTVQNHTYTFVKLPESGIYRILYLFRGNWCSVEFEM